jgi:hypothetical protein
VKDIVVLRKLAFALAAVLIVSLLGLAWFFLGASVTRGVELRDILVKAKTVQAFEYASTTLSATPTVYSEQLSGKTLSQSEVEKIIGSFSGGASSTRAKPAISSRITCCSAQWPTDRRGKSTYVSNATTCG